MFRLLFIGCLFVAIGDGEAKVMSSDFKELVEFFNDLFNFKSGSENARLYIEGELEDAPEELSGKVKVVFSNGPALIENMKISYPDSNTKVCTMELAITDGISVDSIKNGVKLQLSHCYVLLQFSVSNKTGVTIKPETVSLYGCNVKEADGFVSPRGPQVTQSVSNLLKRKAEEYLIHQYNSADSFSYDYFKRNQPSYEEFLDILNTVLISV